MPDMDNKLDFSKLYNLNNETDVQELESLSNDILGYDSLFKEDNVSPRLLQDGRPAFPFEWRMLQGAWKRQRS